MMSVAVFEGRDRTTDSFTWVSDRREELEHALLHHGAVLLRGFGIATTDDFRQLIAPLIGEVTRHPEMIAGRREVDDGVYTPTEYPANQQIEPHNEHSASLTFPGRLSFWCQQPAQHGGETPLIDTRQVYARIDPRVREHFDRLGWMLVRNYDDMPGRRWQTTFRTESRDDVERYCAANGIQCEWKSPSRLRTWRFRPVTLQHPVTGERCWFNHVAFFHIAALPAPIQRSLRSSYREEDLPNNTYYGDGSPIDDQTIAGLRAAYQGEAASFPWQQGDVLLVDNILTAHARNAFSGPRKILLILSDPITRTDVAPRRPAPR
ncbi:MAG: TauD/TfdA family dioxygenase [Vicinamibacterales bacterium]